MMLVACEPAQMDLPAGGQEMLPARREYLENGMSACRCDALKGART